MISINRIIALHFRSCQGLRVSKVRNVKTISLPFLSFKWIRLCTEHKRLFTIVVHRIFFIHVDNIDYDCRSFLNIKHWEEKPLSQIVLVVLIKLEIKFIRTISWIFPNLFQISRFKSWVEQKRIFLNIVNLKYFILDQLMLSIHLKSILQSWLNFSLHFCWLWTSFLVVRMQVHNTMIKKLSSRHDITLVKPLNVFLWNDLFVDYFFFLLLFFLI